jgi:hypothetical protein
VMELVEFLMKESGKKKNRDYIGGG